MEQVQISKEEYTAWKENKVTQTILEQIATLKEDRSQYLAMGGTLAKDTDVSTDFVVGYIRGLSEILNITYEESREQYDH
jgi:hypothetical protein